MWRWMSPPPKIALTEVLPGRQEVNEPQYPHAEESSPGIPSRND